MSASGPARVAPCSPRPHRRRCRDATIADARFQPGRGDRRRRRQQIKAARTSLAGRPKQNTNAAVRGTKPRQLLGQQIGIRRPQLAQLGASAAATTPPVPETAFNTSERRSASACASTENISIGRTISTAASAAHWTLIERYQRRRSGPCGSSVSGSPSVAKAGIVVQGGEAAIDIGELPPDALDHGAHIRAVAVLAMTGYGSCDSAPHRRCRGSRHPCRRAPPIARSPHTRCG